MKAVIYARYSCDRQRETSIEDQVRECSSYAQQENIDVVSVYMDKATSASKDTEKRLNFLRMIEDSSKGLFDIVLVWKLDRFSRDRYDSAHFKHILKKNGVKVISATEHIAEGPEGVLMESILEGMAEYYSRELSQKIKRGQQGKALKAQRNGGVAPFGYLLKDHKLLPDPVTAPIALDVFRRYAQGELIRDIINSLYEKGLRSRNGKPFRYSTFERMLKNRTYIGEFSYSDVVIPGAVPAIVDEDLFEQVQSRIEKNKRAPARMKAKQEYLLTTKLFCGSCNSLMVGESGRSKTGAVYYYYKCRNAKKRTCSCKALKKDWIENVVLHYTVQFLNNSDLMERLIDRLEKSQGEKSFTLKALEQQQKEVEKKLENMIAAIEAGVLTPSTKERLSQLEEQKETLEREILKEKIEHPSLSREEISMYIYQFRGLDLEDISQRRKLINYFVNSVYVFEDRIVFSFNFTDTSQALPFEEIQQQLNMSGSFFDTLGPPGVAPQASREFHFCGVRDFCCTRFWFHFCSVRPE